VKRAIMLAGAACLTLGVSSVFAADPAPKTSAEDFVKAIQSAPCDNGYPRDDQGACYTVTDPDRGFSIAGAGAQRLERGPKTERAPDQSTRVASINGRAAAPAAHQPKELSDLLITFKLGSAELAPEGKTQAAAFASALRDARVGGARFEIAGHTDATGSPDRNAALSAARADAVKSFLVAQGVEASRLESKGYGSTQLAVPTAPQDPSNRRVEARRLD